MKQKRLFALMFIFFLGGLVTLFAFQQPALAAERIVKFKDAGCQ